MRKNGHTGGTTRALMLVATALAGAGIIALRTGTSGASAVTPPPQRGADTLREKAATRLAQIEGTIRVPGLDSTVEVRRDRWGIPHIYARTQHDLFFAQGFVAA